MFAEALPQLLRPVVAVLKMASMGAVDPLAINGPEHTLVVMLSPQGMASMVAVALLQLLGPSITTLENGMEDTLMKASEDVQICWSAF